MAAGRWRSGDPGTPVPLRIAANTYVWLFGRKAFWRWNQRLLNLAGRAMGVGEPMTHMITPGEDRFLTRLAKLGPITVFDVGAFVGEYSTRVRHSCPEARIWAFEPHPASFEKLRTVAANSGFTAVNRGLSDRPGEMALYDYADSRHAAGTSHATLHADVISAVHHGVAAAIEVQVTTVDEFLRANDISHLNLLKIDAEGHELAILRGAAGAISAHSVDVVQFEFNEMNVVSRVFFKDFYEALPGFSFYRMLGDGLAALGPYQPRTHELFILQNVVAIRDDVDYRDVLI